MPFNVRNHLIRVQGGREYLPVAYRLVWFREEHPDWSILTQPLSLDLERGVAVFQAEVRDAENRVLARGTKAETAKGFGDYIEKAETGAVGRALGMLGYGTQFAPEFDEGERVVDTPLPHSVQRPAEPAWRAPDQRDSRVRAEPPVRATRPYPSAPPPVSNRGIPPGDPR